jgi:uncharacterized membrane protein YbaN (DUF454 family)
MVFATLARPAFLALGWASVGLGIVGVIFPVLPTTPFLLVALWAFSRSSPELAERIRNNPRLGPYIRDWEEFGVIPPKAKLLAVAMMAGSFAYLWFGTAAPAWAAILVAAILAAIAAYILTRPGRRP